MGLSIVIVLGGSGSSLRHRSGLVDALMAIEQHKYEYEKRKGLHLVVVAIFT